MRSRGQQRGLAVGDLGVAHTPLRPGGKGRFGERATDVHDVRRFSRSRHAYPRRASDGNQVFVERFGEQYETIPQVFAVPAY